MLVLLVFMRRNKLFILFVQAYSTISYKLSTDSALELDSRLGLRSPLWGEARWRTPPKTLS